MFISKSSYVSLLRIFLQRQKFLFSPDNFLAERRKNVAKNSNTDYRLAAQQAAYQDWIGTVFVCAGFSVSFLSFVLTQGMLHSEACFRPLILRHSLFIYKRS
jgi:hypothetical protein